MRASIFIRQRFGYKYCYIFIPIAHPPFATRESDYNFISPSRDVIVIYFLCRLRDAHPR